jgi:hypothetical protein
VPGTILFTESDAQTLQEVKAMKSLFSPNIGNQGRLVRGLGALALLAGAGFGFTVSAWLGAVLLASGAFVLFESLRGWCALRACGIKTKL